MPSLQTDSAAWQPGDCTIKVATLHDVDAIAPLFDAYRQFYEQSADLALATDFIRARLEQQQSVVLWAQAPNGQAVGFCQLYPSFCSVAAQAIAVLYDLYVAPAARQTGTGRALMRAAEHYATQHGFSRLDLTTAKTNLQAQALYASEGWTQDTVYCAYSKATSTR
jgi:ribosomal protein S18 acetylase RimI-like enzyme